MSFNVIVQVGMTPEASSVVVTPSAPENITDAEISAFGIDLQTLFTNIMGGDSPRCTYFADPCNDGQNWYATYGWPEVQAVYSVTSAIISSVDISPKMAAQQVFVNGGSTTADFSPSLSSTVSNTVGSSTTQTDTVGVAQEVSYGISFLGTGGSGTTTLNYEHTWENSSSNEASEEYSMSASATVPVPPGETCTADLMLSQGTMEVTITYEISLSGYATCGFYHEHNGHHIWAHEINDLLANGNTPPITNIIQATEVLTIGFFANAQIVVRDSKGAILPPRVHFPGVLPQAA